MKKYHIKTGQRFNQLTAIESAGSNGVHRFWKWRCDCGNERVIRVDRVASGSTKSCRCFRRGRGITHGKTGSREFRVWEGMKARCLNPHNISYVNYGGRGIVVCERWLNSFENFLADMGPRPKGRSIERVNNNGNYEPANCVWADAKTQAMNRRGLRLVAISGRVLSVAAWSRELNMPLTSVRNRIARGWSAYRALTEPLHTKFSGQYRQPKV